MSQENEGRRRHWSPEEKAALLRKHLVDKKAVSEICTEAGLQPSQFYLWLRQLLENAAVALEPTGRRKAPKREAELEEKVSWLEEKLAKKDGVIAEISEEYVKLKKELGEP
jgi:transposase-like protein